MPDRDTYDSVVSVQSRAQLKGRATVEIEGEVPQFCAILKLLFFRFSLFFPFLHPQSLPLDIPAHPFSHRLGDMIELRRNQRAERSRWLKRARGRRSPHAALVSTL